MNGTHVSENPKIIGDILRKEWGSDALVMSDWYVRLRTWLEEKLLSLKIIQVRCLFD